jgi:hypothetical protein
VSQRLWTRDRRADLAAALPGWIVARLLVVVAYVVAASAADEFAPGGSTFELDRGLLAWDGDWYHALADRGYGGVPGEGIRFFPLYPYLGRAVGWLFLGHVTIGLLVVANGAALVAGMLLHRLALEETGDEALAKRSAWLLALFPGAFVLVWGYAESLMLVAVIGAFLALRRQAWWLAGAMALAAGLARPLGLFLVLPALWEVSRDWREVRGRDWLGRAAAVLGAPLGTLAFLVYAELSGPGFLEPIAAQSRYRGPSTDPLSRIIDAVADLFRYYQLSDAVHPPMVLAVIALTVVVARRWPLRYALFTVPVVLVSLSAESLNSFERYGLNAFPLVLALATLTKRPELERGALALGAAGMVALPALAWVGNYVP